MALSFAGQWDGNPLGLGNLSFHVPDSTDNAALGSDGVHVDD